MNKILLAIMMGVTLCQSNQQVGEAHDSVCLSDSVINDSANIHFDVSYKLMIKNADFTTEVVPLSDSLEIRWLSTGYNAEYDGGGLGFMILLPKDTTVSRICNTKRFSREQRKLRSDVILKIRNDMVEKALSDDVEIFFDVYFFYFKQESLYAEGGVVGDDGIERPDWGPKENVPLEVYKLEKNKWIFKYLQQRTTLAAHSYGRDKAEEVLKVRLGKIAEDMEKK